MARLVARYWRQVLFALLDSPALAGRDEWSDQDVTRAGDGDNVRTRDTEIVTRV